MRLVKDDPKIFPYFERMVALPKGSDAYFQVRDELFSILIKAYATQFHAGCRVWALKYELDIAECESIFQEGLLKAIESFRITRMKKVKFNSYLWSRITFLMKDYMKAINTQKRSRVGIMSLDNNYLESNYFNGEEGDLFGDGVTSFGEHLKMNNDQDDFGSLLAQKIAVEAMFKSATPFQQNVLTRLREGVHLYVISKELGVSQTKVLREVAILAKKYPLLKQEI